MPPFMCALITSSFLCERLCVSTAWMLLLWCVKDVGERACLRGPLRVFVLVHYPSCVRAATLHVPLFCVVIAGGCGCVVDWEICESQEL